MEELRVFTYEVNGMQTSRQLNKRDAERLGVKWDAEKKATKPANKAVKTANK